MPEEEEEELVELKFRLYDGSDIGPFRYSLASTVAMLKERIVADWPKDKKIAPKAANDIKLINAGKILENNKTVGQCRVPFGDLPKEVITMHVVVQPSLAKAKAVCQHMLRNRVELTRQYLVKTLDGMVKDEGPGRGYGSYGGGK